MEVAATGLSNEELKRLLDPLTLVNGGIQSYATVLQPRWLLLPRG
jgi:hypothetical protein